MTGLSGCRARIRAVASRSGPAGATLSGTTTTSRASISSEASSGSSTPARFSAEAPAPRSTGLLVPVVPETCPWSWERRLRGQLGYDEARGVGRVSCQYAEPSGVADDGYPSAGGQGLLGQQQSRRDPSTPRCGRR